MNVSIRELKTHLSKYLSQVQAGQTIEVTSHRKIIARIVGVPETPSHGLARLVASGAATWSGGKPTGAVLNLKSCGKTVSSLVLEDRS
jgi:prevent-host-death family protein